MMMLNTTYKDTPTTSSSSASSSSGDSPRLIALSDDTLIGEILSWIAPSEIALVCITVSKGWSSKARNRVLWLGFLEREGFRLANRLGGRREGKKATGQSVAPSQKEEGRQHHQQHHQQQGQRSRGMMINPSATSLMHYYFAYHAFYSKRKVQWYDTINGIRFGQGQVPSLLYIDPNSQALIRASADVLTYIGPEYVAENDEMEGEVGVAQFVQDVLGPLPSPWGGRKIGYYEVKIIDAGRKGYLGIGLAHVSSRMRHANEQPGWYTFEPIDDEQSNQSFGYHEEGFRYPGKEDDATSSLGDPFGPTFTTGDTIGCGVDFDAKAIFFTKNGCLIPNPDHMLTLITSDECGNDMELRIPKSSAASITTATRAGGEVAEGGGGGGSSSSSPSVTSTGGDATTTKITTASSSAIAIAVAYAVGGATTTLLSCSSSAAAAAGGGGGGLASIFPPSGLERDTAFAATAGDRLFPSFAAAKSKAEEEQHYYAFDRRTVERFVGVEYGEGCWKFYPTVGLHSAGEVVSLNLGQRPFVFDVDAFIFRLPPPLCQEPINTERPDKLVDDNGEEEGEDHEEEEEGVEEEEEEEEHLSDSSSLVSSSASSSSSSSSDSSNEEDAVPAVGHLIIA